MPISPTTFWLSQIVLSWNYLWFPLLRQLPKRMLGKVIAPFFSFTPLSLCCVFVMCLLLPALIHSPLSYASVIPRPWDAKLINWLNAVNSNAEWHKVTSAMFPETDNNGPHARTVAYSSPPPKAEPPLRAQTKVVIHHLSSPPPPCLSKCPVARLPSLIHQSLLA